MILTLLILLILTLWQILQMIKEGDYMVTIPFYELLNEDSDIWSLIDTTKFPSVYPPNVSSTVLTDEMKNQINEYFYYRQIGFSSPTRFLRAFYRLVTERAAIWKKAVDTETMLSSDDMMYNYNLFENSERNINRQYDGNTTQTPNLLSITTPNLDTTTENTNILTSRQMDTPDGITNDIDNYLSQAQKDNTTDTTTERQRGTTQTQQTGTNTTITDDENNDTESFELRRYGNIGVQTSAEIMQKTRDLYLSWDAYEMLIFPEISQLFLSVVDVDEIDLW